MVKDKKNIVIISLSVIVTILLFTLGYFFLIRPSINNLVIEGQNYGYQYAVYTIAQQAASCPNTGVPLSVGNTTINLVALECYKQPSTQTTSSEGNYSSVQ